MRKEALLCMSLAAIAILCVSVLGIAQEGSAGGRGAGTKEDPYVVPRAASGIRVDAVIDEKAWEGALTLELRYEVSPGENVPAPVRTEVLLTYDADNLYAAFRCFDPDPASIRAYLRDRDSLGGDDWVGLILDTFNDERRSFDFLVTALGVQYDMIEYQGGEDVGWDAIWDSAGRITEWGYVVEIAIPFSSLRFQRADGPQVWGFDAVRRYPREHAHHLGSFPRDRNNNCYMCQALKIKGFEGATPGRNIEISPTLTAVSTDTRGDFPEGEMENSNRDAELGLTAQWGLTANMMLGFTANPDFSQVEADSLQLDVNQPFALFYPERRPFFTEGSDYFNTLENVIHTRTMRDPQWGLKLTGKEGDNTFGAYVVRDEITNLIFPGSQSSRSTSLAMANTSSVFRYKRDIGSHYTVGLLATDREGEEYFNRTFGFDFDFRLTGKDQIQMLVLGSSTDYPDAVSASFDQPLESFSDRLISFDYNHSSRTWSWWGEYEEAGEGFRADLGYYPRVGYRYAQGGLNYRWTAEPGRWWSQFDVGGQIYQFQDLDGNLLKSRAQVWVWGLAANQIYYFFTKQQIRESYNGQEFDLSSCDADFNIRPSADLYLYFFARVSDRIDYSNTRLGKRITLTPEITYNLGRHVRLSFDHTFERMRAADAHLYTANISQLNAIYQFNIRSFFRALFQYSDYSYNAANYTFEIEPENRRLFMQLLFSYKINPRTVLFVGYNDTHYGASEYGLTQSDRTFFVKLGY
ncbi:MAG TPA: DUF5916 domain-containing protein, partial [Acidobacteriota bacterium]|nr:DUF5916 domain-containing protein [Acidobacteriota bacterium]